MPEELPERDVIASLERSGQDEWQSKSEQCSCRRKPDRTGLLAEPTLRASEVMLAAAVRSSGATSAIV